MAQGDFTREVVFKAFPSCRWLLQRSTKLSCGGSSISS